MDEEKTKGNFSAFEDVGRVLDRELQRLIDFVNDRVVPAAREDSEVLLRRAAERLENLADRLAARRAEGGPPSGEVKNGDQ